MTLAERRKHAERAVNVFIAIAGTLAICLFIQHYGFEETTWMQPILDTIEGMAAWQVTTLIILGGLSAYVVIVFTMFHVWVKNAKPMDDEDASRWDSMMRDLERKRDGGKLRSGQSHTSAN